MALNDAVHIALVWLRLELSRRWRSLVVLVVLVAIASGTVMTALAGARRTASALERLESRTLPATAAILANTPDFDWGPIRALPEVESYTTFGPSLGIEGLPPDAIAEPAMQLSAMNTIERGVVQSGRMFDPNRSDEGIVPLEFASRYHLQVGDTIAVVLPTPAELKAAVSSGAAPDMFTGPRLQVRIVGITVSRWFGDSLVLSPGVIARYAANLGGNPADPDRPFYGNALFRLNGGTAAITQFRNDVARVTGRPDLEVLDLSQWVDRPGQQQATFAAQCLVAFGLAAFLAAIFLVGQAVARYVAANAAELQTVRSLGMDTRQAITAAAIGPAGAAIIGAAIGVGGAVIASGWFPIGIASTAEPAPGRTFDWVVFGPGMVLAVGLVAGGAIFAAWLALRVRRRQAQPRRSATATLIARVGLPVPVIVGTRFALEAGRGRSAVPVRPALIGAVVGVLGVVAAFTFSRGVSDAASHPERFGQTFALSGDVGNDGQDFGPTDQLLSALRANELVSGFDDARVGVATGPGGNGSVSLYTYSNAAKPLPVVVTSGRMPRSADEVLLAPQTLTTLHTRVGGRLTLSGSKGPATFMVSGSGLVPNGYHNTYADGGWITDAGYGRLFSGFKFHTVYLALRPGTTVTSAMPALAASLAATNPDLANYSFYPPEPVSQITALREVRFLPIVLGIFLGLLAVGAVGHALATAVRRRALDLAVLRALGLTQRQCRWIVATQASVLAVIGLIFGVPLGLAVGRSVWRAVASYTPFEYVAPTAVWMLALIAPAALLIGNLLASWPGQRAARLRIATILRAE